MSTASAAAFYTQENQAGTSVRSTGAAAKAATSTGMARHASTMNSGSQLTLALTTGYHVGPLFIVQKRRAPLIHGGTLGGKRRRAREARATPKWLTKGHKLEICAIYMEAANRSVQTGEQHVVDHIVPLDGKIVCGLHVPWNLRVIHWLANARKGTGDWPDMPFDQMELDYDA